MGFEAVQAVVRHFADPQRRKFPGSAAMGSGHHRVATGGKASEPAATLAKRASTETAICGFSHGQSWRPTGISWGRTST
jgi:hypothetical protein